MDDTSRSLQAVSYTHLVDVAFDSFRVGVEQQLVRVAAQTLHRVVRAVHTVAVTPVSYTHLDVYKRQG